MTSKKVEILGANLDDIEFSLLNKEFKIGIFRAVANEEGLLLYTNKILTEKLKYDTSYGFLYKKLADLYYNPSEWLKHLDCIKKEGACLFRNVALKSSSEKPVNVDIYFTLTPPYVYGIVRDVKEVNNREPDQEPAKQNESKDNEIIVIDLDKHYKLNMNPKQESHEEDILENAKITDEERSALLGIKTSMESSPNNIEDETEYSNEKSLFSDKTFYDAPFGVVIQKENTKEVFLNKKIKEIFKIKENPEGFYSLFVNYVLPAIESCSDSVSDKKREDCLKIIIDTLISKDAFFLKLRLNNKQLYEYRIYPIIVNIDEKPMLYGKVLYLFEITENENIEDLKTLSFQDHLTGISNRRSFDYTLAINIETVKRYKKPLSLIMFDIDNFKQINDTHGHQKGDDVLKEISSLVKTNIRKSDIFARYGGEEFMIICPETKIPQAMYLAEKIRSLIQNNKFSINKTITCSFGVAQYQNQWSSDDFVSKVDELMYKAKRNGKNRVEVEISSIDDEKQKVLQT